MHTERRDARTTLIVDSIVCPRCEAVLEADIDICPHCGARTTNAPKSASRRLIDRPWLIIVVLLHVGCLGIPFYWQTRYSRGIRLLLVVLSVVYTVFAVLVIAWAIGRIIEAVHVLSA
jgi:ABC-type xylose transport system permease subunit